MLMMCISEYYSSLAHYDPLPQINNNPLPRRGAALLRAMPLIIYLRERVLAGWTSTTAEEN